MAPGVLRLLGSLRHHASHVAECMQAARDTFMEEPVTESQALGVWSCFLPTAICHFEQRVHYLRRKASGYSDLEPDPEHTGPTELDGLNQPFIGPSSPSGLLGSLLLPSSYWSLASWLSLTSHSKLYVSVILASVPDLLLVYMWAPTQCVHLGLGKMQISLYDSFIYNPSVDCCHQALGESSAWRTASFMTWACLALQPLPSLLLLSPRTSTDGHAIY